MNRGRILCAALLALAVPGGFWVARGSGDGDVGPWGLIGAMPPVYWLCLLVPAAVFLRELTRDRDPWLLSGALAAQALLLHGAAAAAEALPRFATAWLHAGFTNQILVTGELTPALDARFSWPGFFSAAAVFSSAVGVEPVALLEWAPTVFVLAYLPPLALLARSLSGSVPVMWTTLWIFLVANWIGQDYFAPQSLALLMFLIAVSVVCRVFLEPPGGSPQRRPAGPLWAGAGRLRQLAGRWTTTPPPVHPVPGIRQRVALLAFLVLLLAALSMTHQLTPFMLAATLAVFALAGVLRPRLLPVIALTVAVGWVSFGAAAFWTGHLRTMFGGADESIGSGVEDRLTGSEIHQWVLYVRISFALLVWVLAALGAAHALRRRRLSLPAAALAFTPFSLLAVQSYGGEGVLRVYLFSLPGMSLLAAGLIVELIGSRQPAVPARRRRVAAAYACTVAILPVFFVARYGNESFERVTAGEVQAVQALYAAAPPGSLLVSVTPNLPWRYQGLAGYSYLSVQSDELALDRAAPIIALMSQHSQGAFLIITRGQTVYAEESYDLPKDFSGRLEREISASGRFRTVHRNDEGVVYRLVSQSEADDVSG